jgi:hypothetical protein
MQSRRQYGAISCVLAQTHAWHPAPGGYSPIHHRFCAVRTYMRLPANTGQLR